MTATLEKSPVGSLPGSVVPPAREPGVALAWDRVVAGIHQSLDGFDPEAPGALPDLRELRRQVERAERRLSALRLAVISHAEQEGAAAASGHSDVGAWNAGVIRGYRSAAQAQAHTARALFGDALQDQPSAAGGAPQLNESPQREGESALAGAEPIQREGAQQRDSAAQGGGPVSPRIGQATAQALRAGDISEAHVRIITSAIQQLPERYTHAQRLTVEESLVKQAHVLTPGSLRGVARRCLAVIEPDASVVDAHENQIAAREEVTAMGNAKFWITDNHDGTMRGGFTVPTLAGQMLKKVLEAMTSPRAAGRPATTPPADKDLAAKALGAQQEPFSNAKHRYLEREHLMGRAFTDLLEHIPTDHLHTSASATMLVTLGLDQLNDQVKAARTETGERISAGTARRLACEAGLIPAVMGTNSVPIDLGARTRLFSSAQRSALAATYSQCAADECERPFAWCEIHHLTPWAKGGKTNLANAVPLCGYHHRLIDSHPGGHTLHTSNGTHRITFHRRT